MNAAFSVRPFVKQCLELSNKYFEVAIFTAGKQWFAEPILNYLDPKGIYFQHRYYQQHTSTIDNTRGGSLIVKDLDIFTAGEVELKNILIVDNNIYSFAFNLEHGIPVQHYLGDQNDRCLL